jgi:DNA-binding GntR family transcriptional regulator
MARAARNGIGGALRLVKRENLSERIYRELRARLQRGAIGAETRLVDLEVAAAFGSSRMPAREALLRLANEGYLASTTRGFMIPKLTLDDIREIFEVRKLLEPHAAGNAARDLDDRGRRGLTKAVQHARAAYKAGNVDALMLANGDFRRCWVDALRNKRLAVEIARFADHVQTVRLSTLHDAPTQTVVATGLEGIYDAFMRRDSDDATARIAAFIEAAEHAFFTVRQAEIAREAAAPTARPARKNLA